MKALLTCISILLLISACEDPKMYEKIEGRWNCAYWSPVNSASNKCNGNNVYFDFKKDKTYYSKLGTTVDTGTYSIVSDELTVSPIGKLDINVEIQTLNEDTLSFLMNSGGIQEKMILLKAD